MSVENASKLVKEYLSDKPVCKVTFRLPREGALNSTNVTLVGEFNEWDKLVTPMIPLENGDFTIELELETGREYHFKYCINGEIWENDWQADRYDKNPFGGYDSVVIV